MNARPMNSYSLLHVSLGKNHDAIGLIFIVSWDSNTSVSKLRIPTMLLIF